MAFTPLPSRQRWATAVDLDAGEIASIPTPLLRRADPIVHVGGKLAAALIAPLTSAGFASVAAEQRHPLFARIAPETAEYEAFGNGYGEVDSARAFRQLVERAARTFSPQEDRWHEDGKVVDPFRPDLRYAAASDREFDVLAERHLNVVRTAFRRARVLLVALSTSEVWESIADGAVFPHWAADGERRFDPDRHRIRTLTVEETIANLAAGIAALRAINPAIEVVLMVSPEPQPATAQPVHVLAAGLLGKAVLRIAMEAAAAADGVHYFPALEIAALHAPASAYGADGAVPAEVVEAIVGALLAVSEGGSVNFDGVETTIAVVSAAALAAAAETKTTESPAKAPRRASKRKGVEAIADDPYTEMVAAQKARKAANRAAKRPPPEAAAAATPAATTETRADRVARRLKDRRAQAEAKIAAREEKADPTPPVVSGDTRREARARKRAATREAENTGEAEVATRRSRQREVADTKGVADPSPAEARAARRKTRAAGGDATPGTRGARRRDPKR